jgi:hypothetical protein
MTTTKDPNTTTNSYVYLIKRFSLPLASLGDGTHAISVNIAVSAASLDRFTCSSVWSSCLRPASALDYMLGGQQCLQRVHTVGARFTLWLARMEYQTGYIVVHEGMYYY